MSLDDWLPKTEIGKKVKSGEIKSIDEIIDKGFQIREAEIVDALLPGLDTDLILVGQSKGKFGGGKRRAFRQTQKKTAEGNKIKFTSIALVGNKNGYIGLGVGTSNETVPAKNKAIRNAKLNIIRIKRGCGSWECACGEPHSIPFKIEGKTGSVEVKLIPAPKGLRLACSNELKKILKLAGIKDIWSKSNGQTSTRMNHVFACFEALKELSRTKTRNKFDNFAGVSEGAISVSLWEARGSSWKRYDPFDGNVLQTINNAPTNLDTVAFADGNPYVIMTQSPGGNIWEWGNPGFNNTRPMGIDYLNLIKVSQ